MSIYDIVFTQALKVQTELICKTPKKKKSKKFSILIKYLK